METILVVDDEADIRTVVRGMLTAKVVAPDGTPLRVGAVVRRIDADGLAFSFTRSIYHRFIHVA